jgi:hypothetical protein
MDLIDAAIAGLVAKLHLKPGERKKRLFVYEKDKPK